MENLLLGNRYKILSQVGVGGMAKVYKAHDELLDRIVAVKILKDQYVEDSEFLKKFNNEAQSAAKLSHVNIVNVFDIGEDFLDGKRLYYIVMEYIEGKTLKEYIDENKVLSNEDIEDFSIQIAQALKCAHSSNIIHRDIKPQNILIDKYSLLKVTDFGIARIASNATITYTNSILGTVHYISPEQAKGKFVDEKSDLYSLGVVMYEMATGKVPFDSDNSVGIAIMHIQDQPVEPKELNPNLSDKLNHIIMKLLSKNPADRYLSAEDLINALESSYQNTNTATIKETRKIDNAKDSGEKSVYIQQEPEEEPKKEKKKKKNRKPLAIILIILLLALSGFLIKASIDKGNNQLTVPTVTSLSKEDAMKELRRAGFRVNASEHKESADVPKGNVISQSPKANSKAKKGDIVDITISDGMLVEVPNLKGMQVSEAKEALTEVGLNLGTSSYEYSDEVEKGQIFDQSIKSGKKVEVEESVDIFISRGPEEDDESSEEYEFALVPDLTGYSQNDAIDLIQSSDLKVGSIDFDYSDDIGENQVISQSITASTEVKKGTSIDITVSKGKQEENDGDKSDTPPERINAIFRLQVPDKDQFEVKIIKLDENGNETDVIYDEVHSKSEAVNGSINVNVEGNVGDKVIVYYDDEAIGRYEITKG